jgi:hypothetical protein
MNEREKRKWGVVRERLHLTGGNSEAFGSGEGRAMRSGARSRVAHLNNI